MKKTITILALLTILTALILSCPDKSITIPKGYGIVQISFASAAKTAMPVLELELFELDFVFTNEDNDAVTAEPVPGAQYAFTIPSGDYNLTVNAYLKDKPKTEESLAAIGEKEITVNEGRNPAVEVVFKPAGEGEGKLELGFSLDDGANIEYRIVSFTMEEYFEKTQLKELPAISPNEPIEISVPAGLYTMNIILGKLDPPSGRYTYASKTQVVHIYNGNTTSMTDDNALYFKIQDFIENVVVNTEDAEAPIIGSLRHAIQTADDWSTIRFMLPKGSVIEITDDALKIDRNIIIDGNDITIMRGDNFNANFFILNSGSSLTLEGNLTINGSLDEGYASPMIYVNPNTTFIMEDDVKLVGNNTEESGGAVFVGGGTFIMNGGTIADNSAISGGGVYVAFGNDDGYYVPGSFFMRGGTISGNNASGENNIENINDSPADGGGGVYVGNGYFAKTGGIIYGNEVDVINKNIAESGLGHAILVEGIYDSTVNRYENIKRNLTLWQNDNFDSGSSDSDGVPAP